MRLLNRLFSLYMMAAYLLCLKLLGKRWNQNIYAGMVTMGCIYLATLVVAFTVAGASVFLITKFILEAL